jgi:hypothetical protein
MSLIANLLESSLSGGLIGGIGGFIQSGINAYTQTKQLAIQKEMQLQQFAHEAKKWDNDLEITRLEIANKLELAELDAEKERQVVDLKALTESFNADKPTFTPEAGREKYAGWFVIVDFWRGIMRPAITAYYSTIFGIFAAWLTWTLFTGHKNLITADWVISQFKSLVDALIFITTTVTLWWFAARAQSQKGK